jgi:hypothetical protein
VNKGCRSPGNELQLGYHLNIRSAA